MAANTRKVSADMTRGRTRCAGRERGIEATLPHRPAPPRPAPPPPPRCARGWAGLFTPFGVTGSAGVGVGAGAVAFGAARTKKRASSPRGGTTSAGSTAVASRNAR